MPVFRAADSLHFRGFADAFEVGCDDIFVSLQAGKYVEKRGAGRDELFVFARRVDRVQMTEKRVDRGRSADFHRRIRHRVLVVPFTPVRDETFR